MKPFVLKALARANESAKAGIEFWETQEKILEIFNNTEDTRPEYAIQVLADLIVMLTMHEDYDSGR